jgi:DNA-directed RNA polymerase specialized sigma24 family protein
MEQKRSILGVQRLHERSRFLSEAEAREARAVVRKLLQALPQRAVAAKLGVSRGSVAAWVENGRSPSREAFGKIMRYAGGEL